MRFLSLQGRSALGFIVGVGLLASYVIMPRCVGAQEVEVPPQLRVFLDCQTAPCDFDHLRREILFADWVRDRESADVHVLVTGQTTGGGGTEYTLTLLERRDVGAHGDTIVFATRDTDTPYEEREQLTHLLALGLVRYSVRAGAFQHVRVTSDAGTHGVWPRAPDDDPWNAWVFRVSGDGYMWGDGRGSSESWQYALGGGVGVGRTTNALKLELSGAVDHGRFSRILDGELGVPQSFERSTTSWNAFGLVVGSAGQRWGVGGVVDADGSSGTAIGIAEVRGMAGPAVEYNVFPYDESTRRLFTFTLVSGVGLVWFDGDNSPFGLGYSVTEVRGIGGLSMEFVENQPWGLVRLRAEWAQVLTRSFGPLHPTAGVLLRVVPRHRQRGGLRLHAAVRPELPVRFGVQQRGEPAVSLGDCTDFGGTSPASCTPRATHSTGPAQRNPLLLRILSRHG
jgi:hypothetical protein